MTDNEIIKALECCNGFECCPEECPFNSRGFEKKMNCLDEKDGIIAKALDLINRQKAEIECLKTVCKIVKEEYEDMFSANRNLMAKVERLQTRNDELNALNKTASQEAIEEFAERLKEQLKSCLAYDGGLKCMIDNLVKEFTEQRGERK